MVKHFIISGDLDDAAIQKLIDIMNDESVANTDKIVTLHRLGGSIALIPLFVGLANSSWMQFQCCTDMRSAGAFIACSLQRFRLSEQATILWHSPGQSAPYTKHSPILPALLHMAATYVDTVRYPDLTKEKLQELNFTESFDFVGFIPEGMTRYDVKRWHGDNRFDYNDETSFWSNSRRTSALYKFSRRF